MAESIFVQVGQCGNQIGTRFWELALQEHAHFNPSGIYDDEMCTFFRNEKNGKPLPPQSRINQLKARALLVDMEEGVIVNQLNKNPIREIFDTQQLVSDVSGSGNNWAQGYHEYGHRYKESILNQVRIQAEHCDSLQSFFLLQSISGGTGSGLGSFICQTLANEYPDVMRMCVSVFPSVEDVVITSPYNSLLCLDTLVNYADCVFPIENKCLLSICDKMNSIKDAKNTLAGPQKKDKRATFDDMNSIVANLLLNLTCSMRFNGELNVDLNEISSNLVPFPKLHFLLTSMAPLFKPAKLQPLRTDQLFNDLFQREFMLVDTNPKAHTYLASAVICRGNFTLTDIRRSIDKLKRQLRFVDWNQDGWKVGHCSNPSLLSERTVLSISNNTSIASTFEGIESRFLKLYRRK
ncbi:tubulin, partial [Rozella allomycis CSF55]